ncbi:hypothetical protein B0T24DRAFT_640200 [Lasiosphaeria ovina]|uniref:Zn(2)-C6 fungal-type domain-containing protein n=1 Tax=Lasiosphaeria ovina TaxID=92902 RepID=A0AAE0MZY2_9PEZI|nr:hypothetical protein B0T24DRAFT_640200 [Lasiosphaeria ovina]
MRKSSPPTPPLQQPALGFPPTNASETSTSKPRPPQSARAKKPTTPVSLPSPTLTSSSLSSAQPDLSLSAQRAAVKQARRRPLNKFACFACQKKKTKCDGVRPVCSACVKRNGDTQCEYAVREGAVSRYADLKVTFEQLERENSDFKDLLAYLRFRPEKEAFEIYRRLRASDNPLSVLQYFREAETLLVVPSTAGSGMADRHVADLDAEALAQSALKVPARPWTPVAGDGLVSTLITAFFKWDAGFPYFFVDQVLFINDMRRGILGAQYCTPLLVNAICALRSLLSDRARNLGRVTKTDLGALFFAEAKKHMDFEVVKPNLATAHGLYLMYIVSCCQGTNRAGAMYRFAAFDVLERLKPEKRFLSLDPQKPENAEKRVALSKTCWGLFFIESLMSGAYFKPLAPPPTIPCVFDHIGSAGGPGNQDVLGLPFGPTSPQPPLVPAVLHVACELSILQQKVITYSIQSKHAVGDDEDLKVRRRFFAELAVVEQAVPPHLLYQNNPAPQTLYLKAVFNLTAYHIIRPLHPDAWIQDRYTVRLVILQLCTTDVELAESYAHRWGFGEYSPMFFICIWNIAPTLVPLLGEAYAQNLFTRGCALMHVIERDLPLVRLAMQGVLALAAATNKPIPRDARPYVEGLTQHKRDPKDLSISFIVPTQNELLEAQSGSDEDEDSRKHGRDLGTLLEKWDSLSMDSE